MSNNLQWYEGLGKILPTSEKSKETTPHKKDPAPLLPSEIEHPTSKDDKKLDKYYSLPASEISKQKLPDYLKSLKPISKTETKPEANPLFSSAIRELFISSAFLVTFLAFLYTNFYSKLSKFIFLINLPAYALGCFILILIGNSLYKVFTIPPTVSPQPPKPAPNAEKTVPSEPSVNFLTVVNLYTDIFSSVLNSFFFWNWFSKKSETSDPITIPGVGTNANPAPLTFQHSAYRPFVSQSYVQPQTAPVNPTTTTFNYGAAPLNTFQTAASTTSFQNTAPATSFQTAPAFSTYRPLAQFAPPAPSHPKYHPAPLPVSHKEAQYQDQLIPGMSYLDPTGTIEEFKLQDSQYQLIQQLRHWISKHLLKSLTESINGIDQFLAEQQLPHLTLLSATLPLEEMVTIFDTQPINTNFPTSLRELYKMYPTHPTIQGRLQLERYLNLGEYECREYMIYRICKLSEGDFLTHYRWNSGGDSRDHWTHEYPTDSELVFHLFCTYIDLNCSHHGSSWLTNRTFSKELRLGWNRRPHDLEGIFIKELEPNHLKYGVIDQSRLLDIPEGRFNLFLTLIIYLTLVRDKLQGRIGLFNANSNTYKLLEALKLNN